MSQQDLVNAAEGVAVVGMSGRFPAARGVEEFWRNLTDGVECISFFTEQELEAEGVPAEALSDKNYVRAKGMLEDVELFDAGFFNVTPKEAEITDPQQRIFLECAWEALEHAGYDPARYRGQIGLFAGASLNSYLVLNLLSNPGLVDAGNILQASIPNRTDHLTTRAAYKLDLKGPALTVQTACSTSLVAVHLAAQSLLSYQCDLALAGGVAVSVPKRSGYYFQEGGVLSADGHCRAFDEKATGTVVGNGAGLVVLKRLAEALADGDQIYAVIRGTAVNNDGSAKVGYTAPSVDGQSDVIAMAQEVAGVSPATVTYVEAHGTGTALGDPVEVAALTQVFRAATDRKNFCALGSVKTNIGHLDTAAGVAGLIKTTLALHHKVLPPSLHFESPNPRIDFAASPFFVNDKLREWPGGGAAPRRAGVSSFGIGGTNAHAVLEEAPEAEPSGPSRPRQLILLSARTNTALEAVTANLSGFLKQRPETNLADAAYTLQTGRRGFKHRRMFVCRDAAEAVELLDSLDPRQVYAGLHEPKTRPVFFMFPGQGAQYAGMARELYETEDGFREQVDRCCERLAPRLGFDLREVLFPRAGEEEAAEARLRETAVTQPALFVVEYALVKLWEGWGIRPQGMIGHSVGEYVAACLAGVFSLDDALALVAARGRLMQSAARGAMLSVPLAEREVRALADGNGLSLASVNAPSLCVVAGREDLVAGLEAELTAKGVACRRLHTSHAFHSEMMEPILEPFLAEFTEVNLSAPKVPFVSNLSGTWITAAEATDPRYWARHLRETVRFGDGVAELFKEPDAILLEVGPGRTLMTVARWHPLKAAGQTVLTSLPHADERADALAFTLNTLGRLWLSGVEADWDGFYARERRRRVALPTYPFERQRYWVEPRKALGEGGGARDLLRKKSDVAEWFYVPSWKLRPAPAPGGGGEGRWLLFADECGLGARLAERLGREGREVALVTAGEKFEERGRLSFTVDPARREDYDALLAALGTVPARIVHLWNVTRGGSSEEILRRGFYSLLHLAQSLGERGAESPLRLDVVTNDMQQVTGGEELTPEKAAVLGPCKVIPQEYPHAACRSVDVTLPARDAGPEQMEALAGSLLEEFAAAASDAVVAYRHGRRWTQEFEPVRLEAPPEPSTRLRDGGVYLITGGAGGIGLTLAEHLARAARAKLVLVGRTEFPPREEWAGVIARRGERDELSRRLRKFQELERLGAEVLVLSADVADADAMRRAVARARERFGAINGVVHAAGVPGGGMIQLKTREKAEAVLAPKVRGALALGELFAGAGLDFMLLCSSRASVLGGFGQVDYCAANAFLDAFAFANTARRGTLTLSVDWDGWQDVGMLVNAAAQFGVAASARDGAGRDTGHPLLGRLVEETDEREVYSADYSVPTHWILEEHRIGRTAVLPGVTYLEMARAAFERRSGTSEIELRDVYFIAPMSIRDDERREVRFVMERDGDGFRFHAASRSAADPDGAKWQEHAIGRVAAAPAGDPARRDLAALIARCNEREAVVGDEERDPDLGPRWQNIRRAHLGRDEMVVLFELPEEFAADVDQLKLHPALLDRAAGTGMLYIELDGVYLPMSYKRLTLRRPLPPKIYAHIKLTENNYSKKETLTFDVSVMDESGVELAEIEEFSEKRINDLTERIRAMAEASPAREEAPAGARSFYQESISEGISPAEGADAFARILARPVMPQIVVSTKDLRASIERANSFTQERVSEEAEKLQAPARPLHPRPQLRGDYVAPRTPLEQTLAGIMQEMLGVEQVGVHDNFFELGGDSVLSIQIIAKANRLGIHITPQQIFQHQTVAELAEVAAQAGGDAAAHAPAPEGQPARPASANDFELAGLDERKFRKLARLLEDADDEEGDAETAAAAAVVREAGGGPNGANGRGREASAVESLLREHPSVREAAVVSAGNGRADSLVAYVVPDGHDDARAPDKALDFSLFYFAADDPKSGGGKYRLYLDGARFADRHGFKAVWTPERHFHESGGLYPSPSVLSAALATVTERVELRSGSVVMPLHHSLRVAEEWSIVDNLSGGRVGLSFTSGWIPNDFAFFPERYADKREEMFRGVEEVRRLWRGQTLAVRDGAGKPVELKIFPRPVRPELPVWLTCSGDPEMFVRAGELGFNVLTALLSQTVEEVASKVGLYRDARRRAGHDPEAGVVSLMMHTFVGHDEPRVLDRVRAPLCEYLKAHVGLIETMTKSLDIKVDIDKEQYLDYLVAFAFERYYQTASLIGTPDKCLPMLERLKAIGVNEVACFIDFGVDADAVLDGLDRLAELRRLCDASGAGPRSSPAAGEPAPLLRALDSFVRERLPDSGAAVSFVLLDALPVAPDGGVDYHALPAPTPLA